jgi:FkbM family methyltransferase
MKALRLTIAGLATAFITSLFFYVTDFERVRGIYLCVKQAVSLVSCIKEGDFDFIVNFDGIRYRGNLGNYVDSQIYYDGAYEKPNLFLLRDLMRSGYSSQGNFIDIGANTGQHSLFMARYSKQVHAFEPWEPVLKRFRQMVEDNSIKNITIYPFGLGNENSKKPFFRPSDKNLGTGSFLEGFNKGNSYEGELEIRIGDEALEQAKIQSVSIIKMDIEGYEKLALQGLSRTLRQHRPIVLFEITINPRSLVSIKNQDELTALFPTRYEFAVVSERSNPIIGTYLLEPIDSEVRFDQAAQHDVVAYPTEKKDLFALKPTNF